MDSSSKKTKLKLFQRKKNTQNVMRYLMEIKVRTTFSLGSPETVGRSSVDSHAAAGKFSKLLRKRLKTCGCFFCMYKRAGWQAFRPLHVAVCLCQYAPCGVRSGLRGARSAITGYRRSRRGPTSRGLEEGARRASRGVSEEHALHLQRK